MLENINQIWPLLCGISVPSYVSRYHVPVVLDFKPGAFQQEGGDLLEIVRHERKTNSKAHHE